MRRAALVVAFLTGGCVGGDGDVEPPPAAGVVREGARPVTVRRGDMNGDGGPELVVASVSEGSNAFGLPTPYLEVFAHRDGEWRRVFDGTGNAPQGAGAPETMLQPGDQEVAVGQAVQLLDLVDLAGDGAVEMVAAISNAGATAGPLELWIVSMGPGDGLVTEYYARTERGGKVAVTEDRVAIEFAVYRPKDPGCCPSSLEIHSIGYDPEADAIRVLERERHSLKAG